MSSVAKPVTTRKGLLKTTLKVSPVGTSTRNTKLRFTGVNNIKYLSKTTNENISDLSETQTTKEEPVIAYDTYKAVRNHYVVEKYNKYFATLNDEEQRQMNSDKEIAIKEPYNIEFDNLPDSEKEKYRKSYAASIIKQQNMKLKKESRTIFIEGKQQNPITQSFFIYGLPSHVYNEINSNIFSISELFMSEYLQLLNNNEILKTQYKTNKDNINKYGNISSEILNNLVKKITYQLIKNKDISALDKTYTSLLEQNTDEHITIGNQLVKNTKRPLDEHIIINNYIRLSILACIDKQDFKNDYKDDNYYFYAYNPEAFYRTTNQVYEIFKYSNNNQDFSEEIYNTLLQNISQYEIRESDDIKIYHLQKIALVYTEFMLRLKYMLSKNIDGSKIFAELFIESESPVVKLLKYYNTMQSTVNITAIDSKYLYIQPVFIIYHLLIELSITEPLSLQKIYDTIIHYIPYCNIFYKSSYQEYIKFIMETNTIHYDFVTLELFKHEKVYKYTCAYLTSIMPQLNAIADSKIIFLDTRAKLP